MTRMLVLTTEQENRLRQAAHLRGLDTERLLHDVVETALAQLEPVAAPLATRIPDLHAGLTWISDDFDAPFSYQDLKGML